MELNKMLKKRTKRNIRIALHQLEINLLCDQIIDFKVETIFGKQGTIDESTPTQRIYTIVVKE